MVVSDGVAETSASITVNVGDVNDEVPYFERDSYSATVSEVNLNNHNKNSIIGFKSKSNELCK